MSSLSADVNEKVRVSQAEAMSRWNHTVAKHAAGAKVSDLAAALANPVNRSDSKTGKPDKSSKTSVAQIDILMDLAFEDYAEAYRQSGLVQEVLKADVQRICAKHNLNHRTFLTRRDRHLTGDKVISGYISGSMRREGEHDLVESDLNKGGGASGASHSKHEKQGRARVRRVKIIPQSAPVAHEACRSSDMGTVMMVSPFARTEQAGSSSLMDVTAGADDEDSEDSSPVSNKPQQRWSALVEIDSMVVTADRADDDFTAALRATSGSDMHAQDRGMHGHRHVGDAMERDEEEERDPHEQFIAHMEHEQPFILDDDDGQEDDAPAIHRLESLWANNASVSIIGRDNGIGIRWDISSPGIQQLCVRDLPIGQIHLLASFRTSLKFISKAVAGQFRDTVSLAMHEDILSAMEELKADPGNIDKVTAVENAVRMNLIAHRLMFVSPPHGEKAGAFTKAMLAQLAAAPQTWPWTIADLSVAPRIASTKQKHVSPAQALKAAKKRGEDKMKEMVVNFQVSKAMQLVSPSGKIADPNSQQAVDFIAETLCVVPDVSVDQVRARLVSVDVERRRAAALTGEHIKTVRYGIDEFLSSLKHVKGGTSGAVNGIRAEHFKCMMASNTPKGAENALVWAGKAAEVVNITQVNPPHCVPDSVRTAVEVTGLVILQDETGKKRPIQMGGLYSKEAGRSLAKPIQAAVTRIAGNSQLCGASAGTNKGIWSSRIRTSTHPNDVMVGLDAQGAFNNVRRDAMAEALIAHVPEVIPAMLTILGTTKQATTLGDGMIQIFGQDQGVAQGHAASAPLFGLVKADVDAAAMQHMTRPDELVVSYADDGKIFGCHDNAIKAFGVVNVEGARRGIVNSVVKTTVSLGQGTDEEIKRQVDEWKAAGILENNIKVHIVNRAVMQSPETVREDEYGIQFSSHDGHKDLGAGIGTNAFTKAYMAKQAARLTRMFDNLAGLDDFHLMVTLYRESVERQAEFLLGNHPIEFHEVIMCAFEEGQQKLLAKITGRGIEDIGPLAMYMAKVPASQGGLGFINIRYQGIPAMLGSIVRSKEYLCDTDSVFAQQMQGVLEAERQNRIPRLPLLQRSWHGIPVQT